MDRRQRGSVPDLNAGPPVRGPVPAYPGSWPRPPRHEPQRARDDGRHPAATAASWDYVENTGPTGRPSGPGRWWCLAETPGVSTG